MNGIKCLRCGNTIKRGQSFCTRCGAPAIWECPRCGTAFSDGADSCAGCGLDLDGAERGTLVRLAAEQNQNAIARLYEQTYRKYLMICTELLYMRSGSEAEDALQDSYIKIFRSLSQLTDVTKFEAWGASIVRNTCLDVLRKNTPVLFEDDQLIDALDYEPEKGEATAEGDPSRYYDRKETSELVSQILDSLSEEQRTCIFMYYTQEMSVRSIAEELNVSENTVKSRLKYGRDNVEKQVLKMEKEQGIRLHNLLPFPFFLAMLGAYTEETEAAVVVSGAVKSVLLKNLALKGAAEASKSAGGKAAGKTAGKSVQGIFEAVKDKLAGGKAAGKAAAAAKKAMTTSIAIKGVEIPSGAIVLGTVALTAGVATGVASHAEYLDKGLAGAYYQKAAELQQEYGEAELVGSENTSGGLYINGLAGLTLLDFNGDGEEDLLAVYHQAAAPLRSEAIGRIPEGDDYRLEIWSSANQSMELIYEQDGIGVMQMNHNDLDWNGDTYMLNVISRKKGGDAVQLAGQYPGEEKGVEFTNITWDKGEIRTDSYLCRSGSFFKNGETIAGEEWMQEVTGTDLLYTGEFTIDYLSYASYSNEDSSGGEETGQKRYNCIRTVRDTTGLIDSLKERKVLLDDGKDKEWRAIYRRVLLDLTIYSHHTQLNSALAARDYDNTEVDQFLKKEFEMIGDSEGNGFVDYFSSPYFQTAVIDINRDEIPELLVYDDVRLTHANMLTFSVENGKLKYCGDDNRAAFAAYYYSKTKPGIWVEWSRMDYKDSGGFTVRNGKIRKYNIKDIEDYDQLIEWSYVDHQKQLMDPQP